MFYRFGVGIEKSTELSGLEVFVVRILNENGSFDEHGTDEVDDFNHFHVDVLVLRKDFLFVVLRKISQLSLTNEFFDFTLSTT